jgi:branched-chain amino acid aminotransferase
MTIRVYFDGQVCEPQDAVISVFDRGFLFGDSVYETLGTHGGRPVFLKEHLNRLARSAGRLFLNPPAPDHIERALKMTLDASQNPESRIRIIVTRGDGPVDLDPATALEPRLVIIVQPLGGPSPEMYENGVQAEIVSVARNSPQALDPAIKSGNYLNNVLAVGEAKRRRRTAHEAILCAANGSVAEGATSNLFAVISGELRTPSLQVGILDGVTRGKVIDLAQRDGMPVREVAFMSPDELRQADEVFITSSVRTVLPVVQVDGKSVGSGHPGTVTRRLMSLYRQLVEAQT